MVFWPIVCLTSLLIQFLETHTQFLFLAWKRQRLPGVLVNFKFLLVLRFSLTPALALLGNPENNGRL